MRGELGERLGEGEVVGVLRALGLLALPDGGDEPSARPHALAQLADEVGVLGEALHEDGPGAVQRGGGVGDPCSAANAAAVGWGSSVGSASSTSASGSSPFSLAICALVRRLGLNGR